MIHFLVGIFEFFEHAEEKIGNFDAPATASIHWRGVHLVGFLPEFLCDLLGVAAGKSIVVGESLLIFNFASESSKLLEFLLVFDVLLTPRFSNDFVAAVLSQGNTSWRL